MTDLTRIPNLAERQEIQAVVGTHDALVEQRDAEIAAVEAKWQPLIDAEVAKLSPTAKDLWEYWGGEKCCKSGLPVFHDDQVLTDDISGEVFLRSAVDVPPRDEEE